MSHLDDGVLAALLDGQGGRDGQDGHTHLAGCADCQARLEALRVTRERAKAILRSGTPSGARPSFEDVLNRRRQRAAVGGRRIAGLRSLAWAATIVLALGVGWYAREVTVVREATVQQLADRRTGGPAETADRLTVDTAPKLAARQTPVRAPQQVVTRPSGTVGMNAAKAKEAANVVVERKDEQAPVPVALAAAPPTVQTSNRPTVEEDQLKKLASRDTQQLRLESVVVAAAETRAAEGAGAPAGERAATRRTRQAVPAAAPAPAVARGFADAPSSVSQPLSSSVAAATSVLGRAPLTVPGLEIIAVQPGTGSVRVTQRMATGILEMIQQRPGVTDESGPSASRAVSGPGVGALVEGIQIRLWGPVSYDSLRALVAKLK